MLKFIARVFYRLQRIIVISAFKITGPPRLLRFNSRLNVAVLKTFGASIGSKRVRIHPPITLHESQRGYANLTINDGCILNGNNFLDLSAKITLEEGVSLGPGVTIMTHNRYNYNSYLEQRLAHTCGKKDVLIDKGAGIKAGAIILMGITVGENAVVAAGAVVNRDIPAARLVAGVPAQVLKEI